MNLLNDFIGIDFAKGTCRINTHCCIVICVIYILCHTNISLIDIVSTKNFYDIWHDHRYSLFITFSLEVYGICLHSTGEEYAHSLAHYCFYGCNITFTCIFGIQLWNRICGVVWNAEPVGYCRCMMWYMTILHEGYFNYLLLCDMWNIEIFPMILWYQRCDINYCDNTDMICKVFKL